MEQETVRRLETRLQYARERGHEPVVVFLDWTKVKKQGTCTVVCKSCRTDIGNSCRDKVHIPCSGEIVNEMGYAPGVKFWEAIQASGEGKLDIARAVDDYVERQKIRAEKKQRRLTREGGATIPKMKKLEH